MKRILFFSLVAVLICPSLVSAALMVYEYVPGERVTLDDQTGNYWYWNLLDFGNKTYDEQITAISGLGTYGYIAGGWHMASQEEMQALWLNEDSNIALSFHQTEIIPGYHVEDWFWAGRYDVVVQSEPVPSHYYALIQETRPQTPPWCAPLGYFYVADYKSTAFLGGAWVTSGAEVVPLPGALILAATGLLSSTLGLIRLRCKHQE